MISAAAPKVVWSGASAIWLEARRSTSKLGSMPTARRSERACPAGQLQMNWRLKATGM